MSIDESYFRKIEDAFFAKNYLAVISIWEKEPDYLIFDFSDEVSYYICEAVSESYYHLERYAQALRMMNKAIYFIENHDCLNSPFGKEPALYHYYLFKVGAYEAQQNYLLAYKTILTYRYLKSFPI